ncbi:helix-turn-helix transcriptional regulator [Carnobacterium maltaromaticum]|uniref:Helix-turn-helix transcriptional regulator n=1 Tax=Carnobacterium maltaromaticum TaxID=2751 RepID=A0AAW9K4J6_CARML|nr:helix-turn-helix transcriptional regulator [Carnobacterium maltaromaticum]MDZ5759661.1 helix-turn-helix transcriptional regulator [Carnobacterium maltaromaticum]
MSLLENIKRAASERKISVYRIEKDSGLSNGTIGKWGSGINKTPNMSSLKKVADYLDVSIDELIK